MRRRLFTASWVLSLLVVAAIAGIWVRSFFVADSILLCDGRHIIDLNSEAGSIVASGLDARRGSPSQAYWFRKKAVRNGERAIASLTDFTLDSNVAPGVGRYLVFPHWILLVPVMVLPVTAGIRRLLRRRRLTPAGFPVAPPTTSSPP